MFVCHKTCVSHFFGVEQNRSIPFFGAPAFCATKKATKRTRQHARIVFHQKSSSTVGRLPPKVVIQPNVIFQPKVVFHRKSSSTEGCLPLKVVFHRRLSSNRGRLPPMSFRPKAVISSLSKLCIKSLDFFHKHYSVLYAFENVS